MFGMFKRKSDPPSAPQLPSSAAVPPVIPLPSSSAVPPPIPKPPRAQHKFFSHEFLPQGFTGADHGKFLGYLFHKDLKGMMRAGWTAIGKEHFGVAAIPATDLEAWVFKHESRIFGLFQFPPTVTAGEAIAALVVTGPIASSATEQLSQTPVRYFVLERASNTSTTVFEYSAAGFTAVRSGPMLGSGPSAFSDVVMEIVFGKKRPTAQEAAQRLVILEYVSAYAQTVPLWKQLHDHGGLQPEAKADMQRVTGGLFAEELQKKQLWEDVSPAEREFLECPVEKLTEQQVLNVLWRREAARVLAWALGILSELTPFDKPVPHDNTKLVPGDDAMNFIASARLRDEKEIESARDLAELWHWRSRTRQLMEAGHPFQPSETMKKAGLNTLEDIIRVSAQEAVKRGDLPMSIADDYPVRGKAYRDLNADEWSEVRSVTVERHFTLNWLCGYAPLNDWDHTPTET
jgi:hypothetical protein